MKFIIEVEDFWLDEEEIDDALKSHVLNTVTHKITGSIKDQVDKEITKKVTETIHKNLDSIIDAKLTELIETGTILINKEPISMVKHLKNLFQDNRGWSSIGNQVENYSNKFCKEMKLQYNAAFATKIVMGMKEQGLLKPELVQMLLEDKDK